MSRATPITPVDATSTLSASQPRAVAVASAISRATVCPAAPVHALAHPLLITAAVARPPDRARCSRETTTGAATARLVVKTAAVGIGPRAATRARSSAGD